MAVIPVQRKPDEYFKWEFDGTQQSVDDLQSELNGSLDNASVVYVSPTTYKRWNPHFSEPSGANGVLGDVVIFCRQGDGLVVRIESDGSPEQIDQYWEALS